jgi:Ca2+-binding EF-hand superfamily protein
MNSISLTQVSAFVVAISMVSFFVNAEDKVAGPAENVITVEKATTVEAIEVAHESKDKFTFTSLDTDKNGQLSQKEVLSAKNQWLVKSFKKIDSNTDLSITEQELVNYVATKTTTSK